ncbi:DUF4266 domain-containing protein [Granulosicoccus sp. 3-233]|uniref:DUF4266 domain-containing protein n=1 Tax=Granulosicoccus sp. 3-233 TaxID=3417969 RepID=UPI003D338C39
MPWQNRIFRGRCNAPAVIALSIFMLALSACSTTQDMFEVTEVKPWQRGVLARDDMQLINDAMEQAVDDHVYFSKEGSTGGVVVQGGGCGCN